MLTFAMAKEGQSNAVVGTAVAFVNMISIVGVLIFQPLVGLIADLNGGDFHAAPGVRIPRPAGTAAA